MAEFSFDLTIPKGIAGKVKIGKPYANYSSAGNLSSFGIDIDLPELGMSKRLKSADFHVLRSKLDETLRVWDAKYLRHVDITHKNRRSHSVDELNSEAIAALEGLRGLLKHTLSVNDAVDWNRLKNRTPFRIDPAEYAFSSGDRNVMTFRPSGEPLKLTPLSAPGAPDPERIRQKHGLFDRLFRKEKIATTIKKEISDWESGVFAVNQENRRLQERFEAAKVEFARRKALYDEEAAQQNASVDELRTRYESCDAKALEDYCDLVLDASNYPDWLPKNWVLEYRSENKILIVDYDLPAPSQLPSVESYRYVKNRDEVTEKHLTEPKKKQLFESIIYQICLRTIHELFEADVVGAVDAVAFNGFVTRPWRRGEGIVGPLVHAAQRLSDAARLPSPNLGRVRSERLRASSERAETWPIESFGLIFRSRSGRQDKGPIL